MVEKFFDREHNADEAAVVRGEQRKHFRPRKHVEFGGLGKIKR